VPPDSNRSVNAAIAANERWSRLGADARRAGTTAAREALTWYFERLVDPSGSLEPEDRAARARNARSAHMLRMNKLSHHADRGSAAAVDSMTAFVRAIGQEIHRARCPHIWPDELIGDAACTLCGLLYRDYSQDDAA
jgi:hypothetical protein